MINKNSFRTVAILFFIIFSASSCKKMMEVNNEGMNGVAYVSIVHAAPKTGSLDLAFDNNRLNLGFFNYTDRVNYVNAFAGNRAFNVYAKGNYNPLITKNLNLTGGKNYTVFIADTGSKMDVVLVRDSSRAPGKDSVRIRLVNVSPDAGSLDLYVAGNTTPVVTNVPYKSAAEFVSLKAANEVKLEVRPAGQSAAVAQSATINLVTGNYYTAWTTGFRDVNTEDAKLRVETFWH